MKLDWHPLSNKEIQSIIDQNFGNYARLFAGCYSKDRLPPHFKPNFYIFNLDNYDGPGTHWVMLNGAVSPEDVYYFDPFGAYPFKSVNKFVPASKTLFYTDDFLQDMYSDMCGYYCIYIAYQQLVRKRDIADIIMKDFSENHLQNDHVVQSLFRTFKL